MLLTACGGGGGGGGHIDPLPSSGPIPVITPSPKPTSQPSQTPSPTPTPTPMPTPTARPTPTAQPTPTATPTFEIATALASGSQPNSIQVGPNNTIWFTDRGAKAIRYMSAVPNATVTSLRTLLTPAQLTYDAADQAFWFTEFNASSGGGRISIIALPGVSNTMTPVGLSLSSDQTPEPIIASSSGVIWVGVASTLQANNAVYEFQPTPVPTTHIIPTGSPNQARQFAFDKAGNLWMSERSSSDLVEINQSTGITQKIDLTVKGAKTQPTSIALGADGNLWVADYLNTIYKVDPVAMTFSAFTINPTHSACGATSIVPAVSGNTLWFADYRCSSIGHITTSGNVTEWGAQVGSKPNSIAATADGNVWYSDQALNQIVRMTPVP